MSAKNILKSIGAVLAGLIFIGITHTGTDAILESAGVLPKGHLHVGTGLILLVIGYRAVLSFIGCYITALLAPKNPMKHALTLGVVGVLLSTAGAIATRNMNLGPSWYAWTLVVIALPIAWLAGKLYELRSARFSSASQDRA
jgi:MFS-type transporter involved in bile tolerance (Atg22 family)